MTILKTDLTAFDIDFTKEGSQTFSYTATYARMRIDVMR